MSRASPLSVVMPVHFAADAQHLQQALDSLLCQELPAAEVIIDLDGPVGDGAASVVASFVDDYSAQMGARE